MIVTALVMQAALMAGCSDEVVDPAACETTPVVGHRCRTYAQSKTKENTVAALKYVARRGVDTCEIDVWKLADGRVIVWHDETWTRVADSWTLPAGLPKLVKHATWPQVKQIRTRGGARVPTLRRMVKAAGRWDVDLMIDVKNGVPDPADVLSHADSHGVLTQWYQAPNKATCNVNMIAPISEAGGVTGLKQGGGECARTPEEVAALGTFVAEAAKKITPELTAEYQALGVAVYPKASRKSMWARMVDAGSALLTDRPVAALKWLAR